MKPRIEQPTIDRGKVYRLESFLEITGMGKQGLRDARDQGLRVVIHGKIGYVSGDDFNDWILDPTRRTQRWGNSSTARQAAERLRLSTGAIYALCKSGKLESHRMGAKGGAVRIVAASLDRYLEETRVAVVTLEKPERRAQANRLGFKNLARFGYRRPGART